MAAPTQRAGPWGQASVRRAAECDAEFGRGLDQAERSAAPKRSRQVEIEARGLVERVDQDGDLAKRGLGGAPGREGPRVQIDPAELFEHAPADGARQAEPDSGVAEIGQRRAPGQSVPKRRFQRASRRLSHEPPAARGDLERDQVPRHGGIGGLGQGEAQALRDDRPDRGDIARAPGGDLPERVQRSL